MRKVRVQVQSGRAGYAATFVAAQLRGAQPAAFGEDYNPGGVTDAMAILAVVAGGGGAVTLLTLGLRRRLST